MNTVFALDDLTDIDIKILSNLQNYGYIYVNVIIDILIMTILTKQTYVTLYVDMHTYTIQIVISFRIIKMIYMIY